MIKRNGDNVFAIASSHNQCAGSRSAVSLYPGGGGAGTRIPRATSAARMTPPDAQHNTKEANIALSTYVEKWKNKYEESERKNKSQLLKAEKARREYEDLTRRYNVLLEERNHLDSELNSREHELNKLKNVSEKLFQEYQRLRHQNEVDSGLMQKVMQQAGEWYKQNKQLKRRSTALLNILPNKADIDLTDCTDTASDTSSNEEVEFLKQQLTELSQQIATLTADLNAAKLAEFEAQEHCCSLAQELETEKEKCVQQEKELEEMRSVIARNDRVSKLLVEEVGALKDNADRDREMAETYKSEALTAKKRVKLLSHQSALLMGDLEIDERLMMLFNEVDSLKEALESQAIRHQGQIEELQLKLAEKNEDSDIFLWEEKIRLAEEDARKAMQRAERAEKKLAEVERDSKSRQKKGGIMSRISYFENGGNEKVESVKEKEIEKIEEADEKEVREEKVDPPTKASPSPPLTPPPCPPPHPLPPPQPPRLRPLPHPVSPLPLPHPRPRPRCSVQ